MKWCKHIVMGNVYAWIMKLKSHEDTYLSAEWKFCPFCGAARPKKSATVRKSRIVGGGKK
jgi:hypothetical protein